MVLTQTIRQNASIDWTIKESGRAKLKVAVKCNREYGYHNDMQLFTYETVVKQAEPHSARNPDHVIIFDSR